MTQTLLRRMMFWLALKLLDYSTNEVVVDTYSLNARSTRTRIHQPKYTKTTGSSIAMQDAKAAVSTSPRPSPNLDQTFREAQAWRDHLEDMRQRGMTW